MIDLDREPQPAPSPPPPPPQPPRGRATPVQPSLPPSLPHSLNGPHSPLAPEIRETLPSPRTLCELESTLAEAQLERLAFFPSWVTHPLHCLPQEVLPRSCISCLVFFRAGKADRRVGRQVDVDGGYTPKSGSAWLLVLESSATVPGRYC